MNVHHNTILQTIKLLKSGEVTPEQIDSLMRTNIADRNKKLNAYSWLTNFKNKAAANLNTKTHLCGLGGAVKANICGQGWPNDCGSRILAGYQSPFDSTAVARLRTAGASFYGVTTMDEFGLGSSTEFTTTGPVHNPWQYTRTAGGSSGGSAAAVAAGLAWFALGTDTGGSVRLPAHCCGVVGFKPTWGRISRHGLIAFASSLDTIGILGRDLADTAFIYSLIAGHDPLDATSLSDSLGNPVDAVVKTTGNMRLGYPRQFVEQESSAEVLADLEISIDQYRSAGVVVEEVQLPSIEQALAIYTVLASCEVASNLARFDGSLFGNRPAAKNYSQMITRTRNKGFGPEVKRRLLLGTHFLSAGYRDQVYLKARTKREKLIAEFAALFSQYDALILPTAPQAAFKLNSILKNPLEMYRTDVFTVQASLARLPAITIPTGLTADGLPLSCQLVGAHLAEEKLLSLAGVLERQRNFRQLKEAPWNKM